MSRTSGARLLLKNLAFTVFVPGSVGGLVPWWLTAEGGRAGSVSWLSVPFFLIGCAIYGWCLWDFAVFGRGTPAPIDAPKRLVVRGLYRYSRNPMYVGVLSVIAGWLLYSAWLPLALYGASLAFLFQAFIVFYEEPHLESTFGAEYIAYRSRVGRWLPRRSAKSGQRAR